MKITSAKQIFKNATCIDFRRLIPSRNTFDQNSFDLVKRSAAINQTAGILVHPLYCMVNFKATILNDFASDKLKPSSYNAYLGNLHDYLNNTSFPVFIFYDPKMNLSIYNKNKTYFKMGFDKYYFNQPEPKAPIIFVKTENENPIPRLFSESRCAESLDIFLDTIDLLGIEHLQIAGETGYTDSKNQSRGCVYYLFNLLKGYSKDASLAMINNNILFPGIEL